MAALAGARAAAPVQQAPLAQVGKPDAAETARILEQFRQSGWVGYFEFDLRAMPRRGRDQLFKGRLWGGYTEQGAVSRIEITDAKGNQHRILLQNGEHGAVWRLVNGQPVKLDGAALFEPLVPGVEINAFDLQMPFLYWPGATVESVERVLGRPAYAFLFLPPPAFASSYPELKFVRAFFDAQFNAPVRIEQTDARRVVKTMSLVDLKKVGEETIPRTFDVRNDVSRDKTRFQITAVALRIRFPAPVFAPAGLAAEAPAPGADQRVRLDR